MAINDGGPAFPLEKAHDINGDYYYPAQHVGMSLRDYFAGQALSGMLAHYSNISDYQHVIAQLAFVVADAMLNVREATHDRA